MSSAVVVDAASPEDVLLSVRDLHVAFPVRRGLLQRGATYIRAVDGVSLDLARGTTFGLVGETGCGKSTLGRAILRLVEPTGGRIVFNGVEVFQAGQKVYRARPHGSALRAFRRDVQVVFQDPLGSLNPRMTVGASIAEPLVVHHVGDRRRRRARVDELLTQVGLAPSDAARYPHELSGGQRQRVCIARALALKPKLIICDEPVSALDVSVQAQILNLLQDLQAETGVAFLFIGHDLAVVRHISHLVAVMYCGKLVEIAEADELYARPRHPYTMALLASVPRASVPLVAAPHGGRHAHGPQSMPWRVEAEPPGQVGCVPDAPTRHAFCVPGVAPHEVPSPLDPPSGCPFHPRCPFANELCRTEMPALGRIEGYAGQHEVACHHAESIVSAQGATLAAGVTAPDAAVRPGEREHSVPSVGDA